MEFIENYKKLFDMVADLPDEPNCSYNGLMKPVELTETPEAKKFDGGDENNPASASFVETEENKDFDEVNPSKDTALKPKVSGAAEVMKENGVVTEVGMPESLKETVKEEITKIRNDDSDEASWDKKANQVKNMFNNNVTKIAKPSTTKNIINAEAYHTSDAKFPPITSNPEFLKVKNIQPVTKVTAKKIKAVNNNTVREDQIDSHGNCNKKYKDWDDNAADAIKKFRDRVDKMKGMAKYTDEYKNRCANLLYKYKDLPKSQFESLCSIMENVNR